MADVLKLNGFKVQKLDAATDSINALEIVLGATTFTETTIATLDGSGKLPSSQLPAVAITDVCICADIASRDALTPAVGDVAIVTDDTGGDLGAGNSASYIWEGTIWALLKSGDSVLSVNGETGAIVLSTDEVSEGASNFYYTEARFDSSLAGKNSDSLAEGISNLYYTEARFDSSFALKDSDSLAEGITNLYYSEAKFDASLALKSSDDVVEGPTNLYYTEARVDANLNVAANTLKVSADGSIDSHSDVDVSSVAPVLDDVLKWNGTHFVPSAAAGGPADTDGLAEGATNFYYTEARFDASLAAKDTDSLAEGASNFYYTEARFDASLAGKNSDSLAEGATNLYYTEARFDASLAAKDSDDIAEGINNLFFTSPRATGSQLIGFASVGDGTNTVTTADTIETAIEKLDGAVIDHESRVSALEGLERESLVLGEATSANTVVYVKEGNGDLFIADKDLPMSRQEIAMIYFDDVGGPGGAINVIKPGQVIPLAGTKGNFGYLGDSGAIVTSAPVGAGEDVVVLGYWKSISEFVFKPEYLATN